MRERRGEGLWEFYDEISGIDHCLGVRRVTAHQSRHPAVLSTLAGGGAHRAHGP